MVRVSSRYLRAILNFGHVITGGREDGHLCLWCQMAMCSLIVHWPSADTWSMTLRPTVRTFGHTICFRCSFRLLSSNKPVRCVTIILSNYYYQEKAFVLKLLQEQDHERRLLLLFSVIKDTEDSVNQI